MKTITAIIFIFLIAVILSGCAAPDIVDKPYQANVIVSSPCKIEKVEKPVFADAAIASTDTLFNQVRALIITNEQRKAYEAELEAAKQVCE